MHLDSLQGKGAANGSGFEVSEIQQGVPGVGASPFGAYAERDTVVPGAGHLAPVVVLVAGGQQREQQKQSLGAEQRLRQENAQLRKALVKKTLEADFLKAACEKVEALRQTATGSGETASGKPSGN